MFGYHPASGGVMFFYGTGKATEARKTMAGKTRSVEKKIVSESKALRLYKG